MTSAAATVYQGMESSYVAVPAGRSRSPHEGVTLLDFQLRFLSVIATSTVRATAIQAETIGQAPGFGEWLAILRRTKRLLEDRSEAACVAVLGAVTQVLDLIDQGIPSAPAEIRSTKRLRDYISHGGRLPADDDLAVAVESLLAEVSRAITDCLDGADLQMVEDGAGNMRPRLKWDRNMVEVWPLMYMEHGGEWCIYYRWIQHAPVFLRFAGSALTAQPSDEELLSALNTRIRRKSPGGVLAQFIGDVGRDLVGFSDADSPPEYSEEQTGFSYHWGKATSEGVEHRVDHFRLGPNDTKEWRSGSGWIPYTAYLRMLANWRTVASRLRQGLERIEKRLADDERELLESTSNLAVRTRDARVITSDMDGSDREESSFSELMTWVDKDLQANRGATQVVFINGEAGIGKTRAMVSSAKRRALEVEKDSAQDGSDLPLFLYVRSTGQVLDSLSTVVSAAVASTRNLTDEAVKALCRNGLMTLLIDGFDELLGGAGYSDALGSLRPWLQDLGGRGVLVLSARSSYYLNQYRTSVDRARQEGPLQVRHRIAEIQRWRPDEVIDFLEEAGVSPGSVQRLSAADQKLLGLPFFARVFADICASIKGASFPENLSLRDKLLEQYVAREENKLRNGADEDTALLDHQQLMRTFEIVAEFMAGSVEREVNVDELEIAAGMAIDDDPATRRGLKQRLTVLCGLATAAGESPTPRFQFQHELFFDQFLAGAATHYLKCGETRLFLGMLGQAPWRSATVTGVVAKVDAETIIAALAMCRPGKAGDSGKIENTIASTNLGALWAEVIRETGRVPNVQISDAIFTDDLDLSQVQCDDAKFVNCLLSSISLPSSSGWRVTLKDTSVRKIKTAQSPPNLAGLQGVIHADLMELLLPDALLERRAEVLNALQELGAHVVDVQVEQTQQVPPEFEAARHYLRKLSERAEISLVLFQSNLQPEIDHLKWTQTYGPAAWKKFVTLLAESGLASYDTFSASGRRKVRFRLRTTAASILDQNTANPDIQDFWKRLAER